MALLTRDEYVQATHAFLPNLMNSYSIEIATRAADQFTRLYYSAYDSPNRIADLPNFYRPTSAMTWNGNPFAGAEGVKDLISRMPSTKHEVQCFDCQPIPGEPNKRNWFIQL